MDFYYDESITIDEQKLIKEEIINNKITNNTNIKINGNEYVIIIVKDEEFNPIVYKIKKPSKINIGTTLHRKIYGQ